MSILFPSRRELCLEAKTQRKRQRRRKERARWWFFWNPRSEDRCPSQPAHSTKQSWTLKAALCLDALFFHTPAMRWKAPPFSGSRATTMAWHRKSSDRNLSLTSSWLAARCWSAQRSVKGRSFLLARWPFLGLLPAELDCRYRPNLY